MRSFDCADNLFKERVGLTRVPLRLPVNLIDLPDGRPTIGFSPPMPKESWLLNVHRRNLRTSGHRAIHSVRLDRSPTQHSQGVQRIRAV